MELQHFEHRHPFFLLEEAKQPISCLLCKERVSGPNYSCKECDLFVLHKSCFELLPELKHPSHPKHPLTLISSKSISNNSGLIICGHCKRRFGGFTYNCSHCEFNLCIQCSSLPLTKEAEVHQHSLTLMLKSFKFSCDRCNKEGAGKFYFCAPCSFVVHPQCTSLPPIERALTLETEIHDHPLTLMQKSFPFTCNACGKPGSSMFYFCNMCLFVAHLDCASLPLVVKVIRHEHPLNLTYSIPATQSSSIVCKLCVVIVKANYAVYYCSSCDFVAHLHCATSKEERDETFLQNFEDKEYSESSKTILEDEDIGTDESIGSSTFIVDGIEIAAKIKHFSHEHDLELIDKHEINQKCDGCVRSIFPPFYTCVQCGFFLHKSCVELPRKIRHPLHQHPLMLCPRPPFIDNIFRCSTCHRRCNGFTYHCDKCNFHLDVKCSLVPYMFKHDCHEHQLILSKLRYYKKCSCCDSDHGYKFHCADCEFIVDFKCLTLPYTMRYREHEHPFTLCYTPEDDSGEYYCDICEEERDPKRWFYFCADCLYPAHPKCILGNFLNFKFEKACTFDIHQHPLTLVQKTEHEPLCKKCGKACTNSLSYECVKCNFNFHTNCLQASTTLEELPLEFPLDLYIHFHFLVEQKFDIIKLECLCNFLDQNNFSSFSKKCGWI